MSLLGGANYFAGPLVGSIIYTTLNAYVTKFTDYWPLTIGTIILCMVLFLPGGLLSVLDGWLGARRKADP
jgi:branched-chain amino acid transport system permease protein